MSREESGEETKTINVRLDDKGSTAHRQTAQQPPICDVCKCSITFDKARFCIDCDVSMCDRCLVPHETFPPTAHHTLTKSTSEAIKPVYSRCDVHKNLYVKVYCIPCRTPLCSECQVQSHLNHDCTVIEEEVEKVKVQLEERKNKLEEYIQEERTHKDYLNQRLSLFQEVQRRVKAKLDASLDAERQNLEKEYKSVDAKNEEMSGPFLSTIKHQMEESEGRISDFQGRINQVQQLLKDIAIRTKSDCLGLSLPEATSSQTGSPPDFPQLIQQTDRALNRYLGIGTIRICCEVREDLHYWSDEIVINKLPWRLQCYQTSEETLRVVLHCNGPETQNQEYWSADVDFSFSLLHANRDENITRKFVCRYSKGQIYLKASLCGWKEIASGGFITDGMMRIEADIKVKSVSGIPA